jgi:hypothetical protein
VGLQGTRIIGDVARVGDGHVTVKVTAVLGKAHGSKAARALRGAWITCTPGQVALQPPSAN